MKKKRIRKKKTICKYIDLINPIIIIIRLKFNLPFINFSKKTNRNALIIKMCYVRGIDESGKKYVAVLMNY